MKKKDKTKLKWILIIVGIVSILVLFKYDFFGFFKTIGLESNKIIVNSISGGG